MTYTNRDRHLAATMCAIMASMHGFGVGSHEAAWATPGWPDKAGPEWTTLDGPAWQLAMSAVHSKKTRLRPARSDYYKQVWAEAEAKIRCGWTPHGCREVGG